MNIIKKILTTLILTLVLVIGFQAKVNANQGGDGWDLYYCTVTYQGEEYTTYSCDAAGGSCSDQICYCDIYGGGQSY